MGPLGALQGEAMKQLLRIRVNGEDFEIFIEPWKSLADLLRDELNLTGVKIGCNEGQCGSCTVLIDGKPVKSCLVLAPMVNGKEILTIEGLAKDGRLHPLQEAFIKHFAIQCGFCTPGFILAAKSLLDENPNPTEVEIRKWLAGNLCRCTGYVKIVEAILAVAANHS
jgi:carbon-monoxide dehydrogenase small subunit